MKDEYYYPKEIKYTAREIVWLMRNVLFQDTWPSDHRIETGYTGGKGRKVGHHANFEVVQMIIAELSARLRLCGMAGLYLEYVTLIDFEDQNYVLARLAGYSGTTAEEVLSLTKMAMRFCCGRRRKQGSFNRFCIYTRSRDSARRRIRRNNGYIRTIYKDV